MNVGISRRRLLETAGIAALASPASAAAVMPAPRFEGKDTPKIALSTGDGGGGGVDYERLHFAYRLDGQDWCWLPGQWDASILSDEAGPPGNPNFTGAFVGMCCQDLAGTRRAADFDYFVYRERGYLANPFVDAGV